MKKSETLKKGSSKKIGLGASIVALTATAIIYLLVGPQGKKNRKILKSWVIKMKGDIVEKLENAKEITQPIFNKIVDEVARKYEKVKNISPTDLTEAVKQIKAQWKSLTKESQDNTHVKTSSTKKNATKS